MDRLFNIRLNEIRKVMAKIRLTENQLHKIINETIKKVLSESIEGISVTYDSPSKGRNTVMAKSIQDAERMIPEDATYFDITKGDNASEEKNLVSWGGEKGYWANKTNPDFDFGEKMKSRELDSALRKRKF